MRKVVVHIEIEDCLQDCPFAEYICKEYCKCGQTNGDIYIDHEDHNKTEVPDWCPYLKE